MKPEERKAAHRRWLESLLEREDDAPLEAWFSRAHLLHQSIIEPLAPGPRGLRHALRRLRTVFSPWTVDVRDQLATDDCVLTRFGAHGKHIGRIGPMLVTGAWVSFSGMLLSRFSNDLAYESWLEANVLDVLMAMGAVMARPGALIEIPSAAEDV
ncbi:MAG: hypothetical protein EXR75_10540 [Myxococcales bacterium]|nr:hypothetical protein [Myxococcales bacterium]